MTVADEIGETHVLKKVEQFIGIEAERDVERPAFELGSGSRQNGSCEERRVVGCRLDDPNG